MKKSEELRGCYYCRNSGACRFFNSDFYVNADGLWDEIHYTCKAGERKSFGCVIGEACLLFTYKENQG